MYLKVDRRSILRVGSKAKISPHNPAYYCTLGTGNSGRVLYV